MTNPSTDDISKQINALVKFVEDAQRHIHQGHAVNLATMTTQIEQLTQTLARLPRANAKTLLVRIEDLFKSIERLEKDLNLQHEAVTERLKFNESHANPLYAQEVADDDNDA